MEIVLDNQNNTIKPIGRLDASSSEAFEKATQDFIGYNNDVLIDMSACPYLSSAGIRALIIIKKKLQDQNKELYLAELQPSVMQVLQMAGLHKMLHIEQTTQNALALIRSKAKHDTTADKLTLDDPAFSYQELYREKISVCFWREATILSLHELHIGLGVGALNASGQHDQNQYGLFVATHFCVGLLPFDNSAETDFQITTQPKKMGVFVKEALSFGHEASGLILCKSNTCPGMPELTTAINNLLNKSEQDSPLSLVILLDQNVQSPSISILLYNSETARSKIASSGLPELHAICNSPGQNKQFHGIRFHLSGLEFSGNVKALNELLSSNLSYENIIGVNAFDDSLQLQNPVAWLIRAEELLNGTDHTLPIITHGTFEFEPDKAFLARQLYTDSAKLAIEQLHGGFSAQTFHVSSYDHEGRKMRPTVLKIAPYNLIERESEGCKQFALPYIFNNSAVVLGTVYFGDIGALRYNFVGIGGESSQLKWLTHYFEQQELKDLDPVFDKIFLQILKPWYGQTVLKDLKLFREHDPTFTFFPHIFEVARDIWGIGEDEKQLTINSRQYLNPYWYLKHIYAKYRDFTTKYPTAICHGDLNMQNILLDEAMNIYLIDFSETRPRAAISDFARLEAIMTIDRAAVETEQDWQDYADFLETFYQAKTLDTLPEANFEGHDGRSINKQVFVTHKMRQYARQTVTGHSEIFPYYLALLEWVLPVICYTLPMPQRKISTVAASLLCQNLIELGFD